MKLEYLKLIMLAAVADGKIQEQELSLIGRIKNNHAELKAIPEEQSQEAMADIYNKLSAGMEVTHILDVLGRQFNEAQKQAAYALAKEVCAADFDVAPAETDFLRLIETQWNIPADVSKSVDLSIRLRYFT
jgi:uncharacterized tellurite resistance protein B-like protein